MQVAPVFVMAGICLILCRIAVFDLACRRIPNHLTLQLALMALPAHLCSFPLPLSLLDRCLAAGVFGGLMLLVALTTKGFGGGDVKLFAALGLLFGFQGGLTTLLFSLVLGGVVGVVLLLEKKGLHAVFSFGPCICLAAFAVILTSP